MADLTISVDIDASLTKRGEAQAKRAIKGIGDEAERTARKIRTSLAATDIPAQVQAVVGKDGAIAKAAARLGISYEQMSAKVREASEAVRKMGPVLEASGKAATNVASSTGQAASGLERVGRGAGIAGAVIAGVVIILAAAAYAAYKLSRAIFDITKQTATYTYEISRGAEETGLATETISALKYEVEATGGNFGSITKGVNNFREKIGQALAGSEEARRSLKLLGIEPRKAILDFDTAFKQAVASIANARDPFEKVKLAVAAFGDEGIRLLPIIRDTGGNIDDLIRRAEALGIVIGGKNVKQAQAFDRAYTDFSKTIEGLKIIIGTEFLPVVTGMLRDITTWLGRNRKEIKDWAEWSADGLRKVADWWGTVWNVASKYFEGVRQQNRVMRNNTYYTDAAVPGQPVQLPPLPTAINANRKYGIATTVRGLDYSGRTPDPVALQAAIEESARRRKAAIEEAQRQVKALTDIINDLSLKNRFFGDESEVTATKIRLLSAGITDLTSGMAQYALQLAAGIDELKKRAEASKDAAKALKDYQGMLDGITNRERLKRIDIGTPLKVIEQQLILGRDLNDVERQRVQNSQDLIRYQIELQQTTALSTAQINELVNALRYEQEQTLKNVEAGQLLKDQWSALQSARDILGGLAEETQQLNVQLGYSAELSRADAVAKELQKEAYKSLKPEVIAQIKAEAEHVDALRAALKAQEDAQRQYEDFTRTISDGLRTLRDEGFGGFFKDVLRKFQDWLIDMAAQWLASKFFKLFYKGGNQQIAQASGQGQGGSILGSILGSLGIGGGGGIQGGISGTPGFNPGYFAGSGGTGAISLGSGGRSPLDGIDIGSGGFNPATGTYSNARGGGGSGMSLVGGLSLAGAGANIIGGMIGGRVGGFISNIGTGLALGAQIGSIIPVVGTVVGAVVGAAVGFFASLFGGDPKRKRDKKEKIPALNKGFGDALKQLRDLIGDVRTLRVSPDSALAKAQELRSQIASGFDIQFESKKYRKIAQGLIAGKLREADGLIAELRTVAEVARAAGERDRRLLPEFATGIYLSPAFQAFRRQNGLLGGQWTGRDVIPAMLARGEMVLNPNQQERVRGTAGFDVFKNAGIPGYASGGMVNQAAIQPVIIRDESPTEIHVYVQQNAQGVWEATAKSPRGKKVITDVVSDAYAKNELTLKKLGN